MFTYRAPKLIANTAVAFDEAVLSTGHCGLFRAPLHLAAGLMPSMAELLATAPILKQHQKDWEVDIKVHMLMKDQYPCIPNWHCDNVPRPDGKTDFSIIGSTDGEFNFATGECTPMFLWVSDEPTTEFLVDDQLVPLPPTSHKDVASDVQGYKWPTQRIKSNSWYSMDQRTPHRGRAAEKDGWRVFARLTHKSIAPTRPVTSVIRRHAQVYLEPDHFTW